MKHVFELLLTACKGPRANDPYLIEEERALFFEETMEMSAKVASFLLRHNIHNEPIIVPTDSKADAVTFFFGIALSGNYYVPLDKETPEGRLKDIVSIGDIHYSFGLTADGLTLLNKEEAFSFSIDKTAILDAYSKHKEEDPLYLMFTSGSTGKPKGVLKSHKNILSFVKNFEETFPSFGKGRHFCNQAPLYFDASSKDIYLALATESALYFPSKSVYALPKTTIDYLNDNHIDTLLWVPSALTLIAKLRTLKFMKPLYLRNVYFIGESFMPKYLNMWTTALPNTHFVNWYGSTEVAGAALYFEIPGTMDETKPLPVGKPLKNNEVLLDEGEILLSSDQVALGYVKDEERNAKTFVMKNGKRWLRTGDYGSFDKDGNVVFESRKDYQIKHLGYRIELQDIEVAVSSLEGILSSCALYQKDKDAIVLALELSDNGRNISDGEWIRRFKSVLPEYMIPKRIIRLDKMPLNPNGKIDRVSLTKELEK